MFWHEYERATPLVSSSVQNSFSQDDRLGRAWQVQGHDGDQEGAQQSQQYCERLAEEGMARKCDAGSAVGRVQQAGFVSRNKGSALTLAIRAQGALTRAHARQEGDQGSTLVEIVGNGRARAASAIGR
ncbi:hypothetical protein E8E14_002969 [Neopestalotiopsis sp. 37M]|nr:hypothetical protein E8E14_002969 [Neopestalotiopsis sp. 37M]